MGTQGWYDDYLNTAQAEAEAELEWWIECYSFDQVEAMNDAEFHEWQETLEYLTARATAAQIELWNHWRLSEHE